MRDLLVTGNERYFPSYKGRSHHLEKPSVVRAAARFDIVVKHLLHKNLLLAGGKSKTDSRKKLRQLGYFGFPRPLLMKKGRRTPMNLRAVLLPAWLMGFFFWLPILLILSLCFIQRRDISLGDGQLLCLITDFAIFGIGGLFPGKNHGVLSG